MDELTIGDKKYVSSKRAAEITGYAKDYVGQLCREGYVEARRVGRNWYVLESAIKDHRFGNSPQSPSSGLTLKKIEAEDSKDEEQPASNWKPVRYEAVQAPKLPSINLLRPKAGISQEDAGKASPAGIEPDTQPEDVHDAWQAWFDTFRSEKSQPRLDQATDEEDPLTQGKAGGSLRSAAEGEERIPIHVIPSKSLNSQSEPPEIRVEDAIVSQRKRKVETKVRSRVSGVAMNIALAIVSVACIAIAAIGTGRFDAYVISSSRGQVLSGISIYDKVNK